MPHRSGQPPVEVFWRPGCPFCLLLRGTLIDHGVEATWRNIWTDTAARDIVREANQGNETVPTVRIGEVTLTNPRWQQLAPLIGRDPTETPRPLPKREYASAGACSPSYRKKGKPMATMQAAFNGIVIAESDRTTVVEGNHYFPREDVREEYLKDSSTHTLCFWKGTASYHDVVVDGVRRPDGAFYYPKPSPLARKIKNHVAFWNGVQVSEAHK